jgi:hypothetical protein
MRITIAALALGVFLASPVLAQGPRGQAPPDHWLTADSLSEAVGLTADQGPAVMEHYEKLNGLMKQAAEQRAKMREQMGAGPPSPEAREEFMAMREKFQAMQTQIDEHHQAIRALLSEEQRGRFDGLPKPQLMTGRRRRPGM